MRATLPADGSEQALADRMDNVVPSYGYRKTPIVGLGGSAGSIPALQAFLAAWQPVLHGLRMRGLIRWAVDVDPLAI